MKIFLTGGGTGGHFYPLIAVARALKDKTERDKIFDLELIYGASKPYDPQLLSEEEIRFMKLPSGKIRRYFSIMNLIDPFKTLWGAIKAIFKIYLDFPDVIFAKGGYDSFPALVAAKIFKIPLVIHESDIIPGKVTKWASKFASRIAVSFPETAKYFPAERTALTGNPVRKQIIGGNVVEANEIFNLDSGVDTILFLGGSLGAKALNDFVLDIAPELIRDFQIIHVTGRNNFREAKLRASIVFENTDAKNRYHVYEFLDEGAYRNAALVSALVVSRAGAGAIFEIAAWGLPSILIPFPTAAQDEQRENAYAYARCGAAIVMEEKNLTPHLLIFEIKKLQADKAAVERMRKAATAFARLDAADKIAEEILKLALSH